jgi:hypothetical protein
MRFHIPSWPRRGKDGAPVIVRLGNSASEILADKFIQGNLKTSAIQVLGVMLDCDTACSAGPGFYPALPGSSPITTPFLLCKLTRSKGPSLHRHYPASQVPLTLSDAQMVRDPFRPRAQAATLRPPQASATDRRLPSWHAVLTTPVVPSVPMVIGLTRSRAGFLPDGLGLPRFSAGSAPHWAFRGLLKIHTRYGLPSCSPTFPWTLSRGSDPASFPTVPPASYRI